MLSAFTFLMFCGVGYAYLLYPLSLMCLPKRRGASGNAERISKVSIIVAARNEEQVIQQRLENLQQIEIPSGVSVQFLVCSDASDDRTDEIVRSFPDVTLVRSSERRGKEYAQKLAVDAAEGEVLIFTDAKVTTERGLVTGFLKYFEDASVGAVSSIDRVEGEGSGEGMYVRYEMFLRRLESQFYSLVGLSGSCFAVRREVARELRENIPSDFALLLATIRGGMRGVLAEDVICTYKAVKTEEQEFVRKVRTVLRGIATLFAVPEVMDFKKYGPFAWEIVSHKLCRWLVPWFLLLGTCGAFTLEAESSFWALISFGLVVFYVLAGVGFFAPGLRDKRWIKLPLFFCVTNTAIAVAWVKYFRGERSVSWNPSAR